MKMALRNREFYEYLPMRLYRILTLLFGFMIAYFLLAEVALSSRKLSDKEKKETVYKTYQGYKKDFPDVNDISPLKAMELLDQNKVVFVDTRKPEEMAVSILPAAVSGGDFLNHLEQYRDKIAVSYCTISYRSGKFAERVAQEGITVFNLQGGILAWTLEGGKIYDPSGNEVKRIHVYGDQWDYAPSGYESVKFGLWRQIF